MSNARLKSAWHRGGPRLMLRVVAERAADRWHDARLGMHMGGLVPIETLIPDWEGCHDYFPTSLSTFRRMMRLIDIRAGEDVFVDLGAGMGRALVAAADFDFKRVVGVEISDRLCATARRNVARRRDRLRTQDIAVVHADAAQYAIPDDATVFYLYNPFHGAALRSVFDAIGKSLQAVPRRMWVLFNNTAHFAALEADYPWLVPVHHLELEHDCAIYRTL
jgi:SAM-dependent methyltransferase